jgi:hypothetical protein
LQPRTGKRQRLAIMLARAIIASPFYHGETSSWGIPSLEAPHDSAKDQLLLKLRRMQPGALLRGMIKR